MAESNNQKLAEKNIPGMNRHERFDRWSMPKTWERP